MIRSFLGVIQKYSIPSTLWNSLVHYYTGDSTPNDSLGVYNGTLVNGATYATGKINNAFSFDGVNDYLSTSVTSSINYANAHTFSCWVRPSSVSGTQIFMGFNTASPNGSAIGFRNGGNLTFFKGFVDGEVNSTTNLAINTWYHIVGVYKGNSFGSNNVLLYVNGSLVHTGTLTQTSVSWKLFIGSNSGGSGGYFNGLIDECAVWSKVLTATEITELYNAGAGKQYLN